MEIVEILHPIDCWYNFLIGIGGFGKVYSSSMFLYVLVQITTKILNLKLSFWNSFFKLVFSCVEKSTQISSAKCSYMAFFFFFPYHKDIFQNP